MVLGAFGPQFANFMGEDSLDILDLSFADFAGKEGENAGGNLSGIHLLHV